jgi:hypothetical protein
MPSNQLTKICIDIFNFLVKFLPIKEIFVFKDWSNIFISNYSNKICCILILYEIMRLHAVWMTISCMTHFKFNGKS